MRQFRCVSFVLVFKEFLCLYSLSLKELSVNLMLWGRFLLVYWFFGMTSLQYITFCCMDLSFRGQKDLLLQLQEDFDDFDLSLLKTSLL